MVSEGLRLPSPVLDPPEPPSTSAQDASQDIQLRGTGLGADAATSEASIEPALDNRELEKVVLPPTPPETPLLDAGLPVEETSAPNPSAKTALLGNLTCSSRSSSQLISLTLQVHRHCHYYPRSSSLLLFPQRRPNLSYQLGQLDLSLPTLNPSPSFPYLLIRHPSPLMTCRPTSSASGNEPRGRARS